MHKERSGSVRLQESDDASYRFSSLIVNSAGREEENTQVTDI